MFVIASEYPQLQPENVILGDVSKKRFIKSFKRGNAEILFGKLKRIFPYGDKFSTETEEIISLEKAIYNFGGKLYKFFNDSFKEIKLVRVVEKKELATPKKCRYKMYLATFYDVVSQLVTTEYLVVPT